MTDKVREMLRKRKINTDKGYVIFLVYLKEFLESQPLFSFHQTYALPIVQFLCYNTTLNVFFIILCLTFWNLDSCLVVKVTKM